MSDRQESEPDLRTSTRAGFVWLLRHPELWEGTLGDGEKKWDYGNADSCALAVWCKYWGRSWDYCTQQVRTLQLDNHGHDRVFFDMPNDATPQMVADELEKCPITSTG